MTRQSVAGLEAVLYILFGVYLDSGDVFFVLETHWTGHDSTTSLLAPGILYRSAAVADFRKRWMEAGSGATAQLLFSNGRFLSQMST